MWDIRLWKYRALSYWYRFNYWLFNFIDGFSLLKCSNCGGWRFRRDLKFKETTYGFIATLCNECYDDLYAGYK